MPVSMAYDYTCRFCSALSSVFVSLDVAFRATRVASHGHYEEAKKIVLEQ
jgi:glutaredoxin